MRFTKIIATLGPASDSAAQVRELLAAGVDVFRLNASHGTAEEHARRVEVVRGEAARLGRDTGILLDLQGPKIRLGLFEGGRCTLQDGAPFTLTTEPVLGNARRASTNYAALARDVRPGDRVLLADGSVELQVLSTDGVAASCQVVAGGEIGDRKGINLPGVAVSTPSLTEKDLADLEFGLRAGVDFIALSFVRSPADVLDLRRRLEARADPPPLIAKIEKPEAWDQLAGILDASDGIMVARGDLGVEMPAEKVPMIQKEIIRRARLRGRFVITATQMLESMVDKPAPTRAEVSDVANAVFDGTDAVMLSAETSVGKYPVEAVRRMARIAEEADQAQRTRGWRDWPAQAGGDHAEIVAEAAYHAARSAQVGAIAVFTSTGSTARRVSRFRPRVPVFAFTPSPRVARCLSLLHGVRALPAPPLTSTDEMLALTERDLLAGGHLERGDSVVVVAGQPIGRPGGTNLMKLHRLGE